MQVYSFSGENDEMQISNGVTVLRDTDDIFYGGNLKIKNIDLAGVNKYTESFYVLPDGGGEKDIILSNQIIVIKKVYIVSEK